MGVAMFRWSKGRSGGGVDQWLETMAAQDEEVATGRVEMVPERMGMDVVRRTKISENEKRPKSGGRGVERTFAERQKFRSEDPLRWGGLFIRTEKEPDRKLGSTIQNGLM